MRDILEHISSPHPLTGHTHHAPDGRAEKAKKNDSGAVLFHLSKELYEHLYGRDE